MSSSSTFQSLSVAAQRPPSDEWTLLENHLKMLEEKCKTREGSTDQELLMKLVNNLRSKVLAKVVQQQKQESSCNVDSIKRKKNNARLVAVLEQQHQHDKDDEDDHRSIDTLSTASLSLSTSNHSRQSHATRRRRRTRTTNQKVSVSFATPVVTQVWTGATPKPPHHRNYVRKTKAATKPIASSLRTTKSVSVHKPVATDGSTKQDPQQRKITSSYHRRNFHAHNNTKQRHHNHNEKKET